MENDYKKKFSNSSREIGKLLDEIRDNKKRLSESEERAIKFLNENKELKQEKEYKELVEELGESFANYLETKKKFGNTSK